MKNENNVKQSDWYIDKYGTQSEVTATSSETSVKVPTFSMDISGVNSNKSVDADFFKNKLIEKDITFSESVEQITPRVREERVKPEGKGSTASFGEVIKMKLFLVILFGKALNNLSVMIIGKLRCKIMILV
jgi:hypothetical protein